MSELDYKHSKILIVDDNPGDIDVLVEILHEFDVRTVLDGESALEAVKEELPDLILLDITLPGINGFEVCTRLKQITQSAHIPIIFLSIRTDVDNILQGFNLGGVDYITKPYLPQEAVARIKTHLSLCNAIATLNNLANIDPLSGIANRRHFFKHATIIFEEAKVEQHDLYIFIIDIDNFKLINDTYGHAVGDKTILALTNSIETNVSNIVSFARLGGDEFILMLKDIDKIGAQEQLEALREQIASTLLVPEHVSPFTISIGMAENRESDKDIDALLLRADMNLYKSKRTKNALNV